MLFSHNFYDVNLLEISSDIDESFWTLMIMSLWSQSYVISFIETNKEEK